MFTDIMAQKKSFTLNDLMGGGNSFWALQPENLYTAWWGNTLVETDVECCKQLTDERGNKIRAKELFTLDRINSILKADDKNRVHTLQSAVFPQQGKSLVLVHRKGEKVLVDWKAGKVVWTQQHLSSERAVDESGAPSAMAFVRDNNLYVRTTEGRELQVSTDGSREIVYGQSVHREEFGITKGTFWNPQGSLLAFYRMDQSMVSDYPQVDISARIAAYKPDKYPMAGETSHVVSIGVFNPETAKTTYLQTANPVDRYFTNISWSPDGKTVYVQELNRDQNHMELISYDAATGAKLKVLYEERHAKYVEPQTPITFLPWDTSKFILQSQRDGYNHLYLFDKEGHELRQLTQGKFVVLDLIGFNEKDKSVIILSTEKSPLQHNLYSVSLKTGRRKLLDEGSGVHTGRLSADGSMLVDAYSSPTVARSINLIKTSTGKRENLLTASEPWDAYEVPEISCGSIKASDGTTDLYYRMVKPIGFDAKKKYPTVVYVYGGPHARNVLATRHWQTRGWEIYMAQKGYLLFILDNRGSSERGLDFENVTFRHLGVEEMKDKIKGVEYLKSLPFVDANRIGVHGWSFGGFMTTNLILTYPDIFKVGVAGGPVIDWKYYEVMYGERYMDTPQQNPDGYDGSNLCKKAGNLKGRLQIIIGYNDPTCVPQHSLSFLRAAEDAGTQPDFFTYPGDGHNMFGRDQVHLHERITRYFDDYLKPLTADK